MNKTAITVSQLNQYIKGIFEADLSLRNVWVVGEISNLTIHSSGHIYFRLKDEGGIIGAVMFRSSVSSLKFRPENGMKILAKGNVSIFEKTGVYQLYVTEMKEEGTGDLYVALEQLKKQLATAGIFAQEHKKMIPKFPRKIGVITSPTGAAIRDIINILGRRFPLAEVMVYPAIVQGDQAPQSLIDGIDYFEREACVDVIIIGRGGGSIEDLWGFNDPDLALSIYNCETPVISAVGHETDFTICDFVADLRAPTPSGAAELAVPDQRELLDQIYQYQVRLSNELTASVKHCRERLERYANARVLKDPSAFTDKPYMMLDHLDQSLKRAMGSICTNYKLKAVSLLEKLDALSPLKVMKRGFCLAETTEGAMISSVQQLEKGEQIQLRISDGQAICTVDEICEGKHYE